MSLLQVACFIQQGFCSDLRWGAGVITMILESEVRTMLIVLVLLFTLDGDGDDDGDDGHDGVGDDDDNDGVGGDGDDDDRW